MLGIDARNFKLGNNAGSDHQSFTRLGIDSVFFSRDYDLLHTPQDSIDQIHPEWLGEAGRVALQALMDLTIDALVPDRSHHALGRKALDDHVGAAGEQQRIHRRAVGEMKHRRGVQIGRRAPLGTNALILLLGDGFLAT